MNLKFELLPIQILILIVIRTRRGKYVVFFIGKKRYC